MFDFFSRKGAARPDAGASGRGRGGSDPVGTVPGTGATDSVSTHDSSASGALGDSGASGP